MSAAEAEAGGNGAVENDDGDGVVDLGVLDATAASGRDTSKVEEYPSSRGEIWECLEYINYTGSCCASDKADGTTLTPALPTTLGLRVTGVGDLALPLSDWHAKTLKSNINTVEINNGSYHKAYTVDSKRVRIKNPVWKSSLEKLVQTVAYKLGVDPTKLTAELQSLLYMEKGSYVERCKTTDEGGNVLGTLFVQLPSVFTGGKIRIFNAGEHEDDEDGDEDGKEEETSFQLGASGDASFACHFVCHYKDCEYEFAKIKSGSRVLLRYSLHYKLGKKEKLPTVRSLNTSMSFLKWSLENLPPVDKMVLISTEKEFHASTIEVHGINALSYKHRRSVEAIKAAAGEGWKLLIVNAEMVEKQKTNHYDDIMSVTSTSSILQIFDEEGNDVTEAEKWLKNVVDFDSALEGSDTGMVLDVDMYGGNEWWGECKNTEKRSRTITKHYRASFLLVSIVLFFVLCVHATFS